MEITNFYAVEGRHPVTPSPPPAVAPPAAAPGEPEGPGRPPARGPAALPGGLRRQLQPRRAGPQPGVPRPPAVPRRPGLGGRPGDAGQLRPLAPRPPHLHPRPAGGGLVAHRAGEDDRLRPPARDRPPRGPRPHRRRPLRHRGADLGAGLGPGGGERPPLHHRRASRRWSARWPASPGARRSSTSATASRWSPGDDLFHAVQEKFNATSAITESFSFNATRTFTELAAQANANRITFYTLDAGRPAGVLGLLGREPERPGQRRRFVHTNNLQAPLRYVASSTGGLAILNTNRAHRHARAGRRGLQDLLLARLPGAPAGRGRYHKIDVKVKRKGVEVRHRDGYRDKTPEARMADSTMSLLYFPFERNAAGGGPRLRRRDGARGPAISWCRWR